MSFFENFTEKAKMYANMAAEKAKDVAEVAADKAKDVKETAQLTMAIKTEQRELDKNYRAIGQWFASEYEGGHTSRAHTCAASRPCAHL